MQCPNCRTNVANIDAFCHNCRAYLSNHTPPDSPTSTSSAMLLQPLQALSTEPTLPISAQLLPQHSRALGTLIRQYPGAKHPGLFNFFYRMHCPFCNAQFHPGDCAIHAAIRYDKNNPDASILRAAPRKGWRRFLARLYTKQLNGAYYLQEDARRQCPTCKNLFPYRLEVDACFNIAIVGDTFSGKTHYMASLLHQIKFGEATRNPDVRISLKPLTQQTKESFTKYQETLFNNHVELGASPRFALAPDAEFVERDPLIFQLEISYKQKGKSATSVINLIFYDISGEDIRDDDTMIQFGWPILQAQAIIHIADPLAIPSILNKLPTSPQVETAKKLQNRPTTDEILNNLIALFQRQHRLDLKHSIETPVAIMLSKSDLLAPIAQQYGFTQARFLQDTIYDGTVNIEDLKSVDHDVRDFLDKKMGEIGLLQTSIRFSHVGFFASSATGCVSDQQQHFSTIKPRRCLDPFLWVLGELTKAGNSNKGIFSKIHG